ncbi:MAG TPA: hypothetical protein VKR30_02565 [Candidatus Limnocylindrales bacterium]|nr:hypothetical protein [Candidatus Limnocylindrales bacterium]
MIAAAPGFVAVGSASYAGPGLVWSSGDGSTWQVASHVTDVTQNELLLTVAAGPSGTVALGPQCNGECSGGIPIVSADLATWRTGTPLTPPFVVAVKDAIWDGSRYLAVGDEITDASPVGYNALAWTSANGLAWTLAPDSAALDRATMSSIVKGGPGYVAVGAGQETSGFRGAAWTSPDGTNWTRVPDGSAFDNAFIFAVTAGGPGFVAVGRGANGAAVWTSSDGAAWQRVPDSPALANAEMHGVVAGPGGLVAVGYDHDGAIIWTSADGTTWTRIEQLANAAGAQALAVAQAKGTYVAVGGGGPSGTAQPYVWVGR